MARRRRRASGLDGDRRAARGASTRTASPRASGTRDADAVEAATPRTGDRRNRARLAHGRRAMLEQVDEPRRLRRRGARPRAHAPRCCSAWAARAWHPRCSARRSAPRRASRACTCSTTTDPAAVRPCEAAPSISSKTLFIVSSKSGGTTRDATLFRLLLRRRASRRRRAGRTSSPSPTRARRSSDSAESAGFRAHLRRTSPTSAAATRRCRFFGLVPGRADRRRRRRAAATAAQPMAAACAACVPAAGEPGGSARRAFWARLPWPGATRSRFVLSPGHRELRPLGRAADRREHRQGGQGHPAGGRRAARPAEVYGDDRVFVPDGPGPASRRRRRAGSTALAAGRTSGGAR